MGSQQIYVSIEPGEETHKVGKLWFHQPGSRQSASFEYDPDWLKHSEKFALDPALQLTSGAFHTTPDQILFEAIGDSAPDRRGRVLMRRAESVRAKSAREAVRTEQPYSLGQNPSSWPVAGLSPSAAIPRPDYRFPGLARLLWCCLIDICANIFHCDNIKPSMNV